MDLIADLITNGDLEETMLVHLFRTAGGRMDEDVVHNSTLDLLVNTHSLTHPLTH